jgi:hypothetical protein
MWIALLVLAVVLPGAVALLGLKSPLSRHDPGDDLPLGGL